ncbi:unnamed protein product [Jaminaea pallidilutea]
MAATDTIQPSRPSLRQSHHVISYTPPDLIPGEAAELTFVVSLLHLTDSVFVWCGQSEYGIDQMLAGSNTVEAAAADKNAVEAAAMEQEALASLSEEDRRQLQVEREADAQLEQAMREAGRSGDGDGDGASLEAIRVAPKGVLARHWGMAMQGRSGKPPAKSALFRTSSDLATPIAGRLAARHPIQQIHLSLSIDPELLGEGGPGGGAAMMPPLLAAPGSNRSGGLLFHLEKGIDEMLRSELATKGAT